MPPMDFIRNRTTEFRNRTALRRPEAAPMTIELKRGKFLRVHGGAGNTVTVLTGAVWITEQDSARDIMLAPGRSFTLRQPGLSLIEAFHDASISYES
jgi:hypothetical protein